MKNNEVICGIAALRSISDAYNSLQDDVLQVEACQEAAAVLMDTICGENPALLDAEHVQNTDAETADALGSCTFSMPEPQLLRGVLQRRIPRLLQGDAVMLPVRLDYGGCIRMVVEAEDDTGRAASFAQSILFTALKNQPNTYFRCADLVSGGSFFSYLHSVIAELPAERTGGGVCSKPGEFDDLIKQLETVSKAALQTIGGAYASVYEYNQHHEVKLPEYMVILHLAPLTRNCEEARRLQILMENGPQTGISFLVTGSTETVKPFSEKADYHFQIRGGEFFLGGEAELPFTLTMDTAVSNETVASLVSALHSSSQVDTLMEHHPELQEALFSMDSADVLRIPFALDNNNRLQYFEIGGNAPTHALIAGSTGSGKSVLLHTLILQTIRNYHPDDVEIWAIDYKAVEFDGYIQHRTPHFRVIAHDTSDEFSLSLVDKIYQEYVDRQKRFLDAGVKNINQYRAKMGAHSMPRILVVIDEFQFMTQAVQAYTGNENYRTKLENLFRLTRAMGISMILCSQTIASGLSGLTDAARDQIGCRLCLKHEDASEIRETLMVSETDARGVVEQAKNLSRGQGIYKRQRRESEGVSQDGKAYEFIRANVLYINDTLKDQLIDQINDFVGDGYTPKDMIIVRGGGRVRVEEKDRHPISQFLRSGIWSRDEEELCWYPAAPTTLEDAFTVHVDRAGGANLLLVGEDADLRESVVFHSLCSFLMNPDNRITAVFVDETNAGRVRMLSQLQQLHCDRLTFSTGIQDALETIYGLRKIRPVSEGSRIFLWYGLDKLKNEIFLKNQDDEDEVTPKDSLDAMSKEDLLADLFADLTSFNEDSARKPSQVPTEAESLSYENCRDILLPAFEAGPENGLHHFAVFNNRKAVKNSGVIKLENFEKRIGTRMSGDDSYDLFGSSMAINKTDETTVVYYAGSGAVTPLRPYRMPDANWIDRFNQALEQD